MGSNKKDHTVELVETFTKDIRCLSPAPSRKLDTRLCIALTGTTGFVGKELLLRFIEDPKIDKIYCLNRSETADTDCFEALQSRGGRSEIPDKVQFLRAFIGDEHLNLSDPKYSELLREVHTIVHCAWDVDFTLAAEKFKFPHLRGIRNIVELCTYGDHRPGIIFMSSLSSISKWSTQAHTLVIPEAISPTISVAASTGYAMSKQAAEKILETAARNAKIPVSIIRLGAVIGDKPSLRQWGEYEWFPPFLAASARLHVIPRDLPDIHWTPIDTLTRIVDELLHHFNDSIEVYNLANVYPAAWASIRSGMQESLGSGARLVTLRDWIELVKDHLELETQLEPIGLQDTRSSLDLLEQFADSLDLSSGEGVPAKHLVYANDRLQAASPTARKMQDDTQENLIMLVTDCMG